MPSTVCTVRMLWWERPMKNASSIMRTSCTTSSLASLGLSLLALLSLIISPHFGLAVGEDGPGDAAIDGQTDFPTPDDDREETPPSTPSSTQEETPVPESTWVERTVGNITQWTIHDLRDTLRASTRAWVVYLRQHSDHDAETPPSSSEPDEYQQWRDAGLIHSRAHADRLAQEGRVRDLERAVTQAWRTLNTTVRPGLPYPSTPMPDKTAGDLTTILEDYGLHARGLDSNNMETIAHVQSTLPRDHHVSRSVTMTHLLASLDLPAKQDAEEEHATWRDALVRELTAHAHRVIALGRASQLDEVYASAFERQGLQLRAFLRRLATWTRGVADVKGLDEKVSVESKSHSSYTDAPDRCILFDGSFDCEFDYALDAIDPGAAIVV